VDYKLTCKEHFQRGVLNNTDIQNQNIKTKRKQETDPVAIRLQNYEKK